MQPIVTTAETNKKPMVLTPIPINLDWLDKLPFIESFGTGSIISTPVTSCHLKGNKALYFPTCTVPGKLENRILFIKKIVLDIVQNCPKDEPLVFISLGSGELLMEYLIGKAVIENGFQDLSFFLIDPQYTFYESKNRQKTETVLTDFRKLIGSAYSTKWNEPLPKDRIRYFSRATNVSKYPLNLANIVLIECLPPCGELIKALKRDKLPERSLNEYFMGSKFVQPEHANSIAFLPDVCEEQYRNQGVTLAPFSSLPYIAFQKDSSQPKYCIDWGCKIYTDGSFFLKFFGAEGFCAALPFSPTQKIQLNNEKSVIFSQWFPTIEQNIRDFLENEILSMQQHNPQKKLVQSEKTALLQKVKEIFNTLFIGAKDFYMADYSIDRAEMLEFLVENAGHHYRKAFSLFADAENSYAITEQVL